MNPVGVIRLLVGLLHRVDLLQYLLGFRLFCLGCGSHEPRNGQCSQDTDDDHHDHQLDQGEALLALVKIGQHVVPPLG